MITFSHVTKTYRTNIGLDDVSFDIEKGDFVFLVGPSGAGKSTFIKLILKEIDADEGSIIVDDKEVTTLSNREVPELRRKIGTVFQDFRLLPKKTVFENVAFAMEVLHKSKRQIRKQVPQVLSLVGITDKAHKYPEMPSFRGKLLLYAHCLRKIGAYPVIADTPVFSSRLKGMSGKAKIIKAKAFRGHSHLHKAVPPSQIQFPQNWIIWSNSVSYYAATIPKNYTSTPRKIH